MLVAHLYVSILMLSSLLILVEQIVQINTKDTFKIK